MIHLVLLSGGSGTRLWPLSNETRSKQFLKVLRDEAGNHVSMVQRVFAQIENVPADVSITIATGESQLSSIERQIGGKCQVVTEPERRDTAPAIMLSCAYLASLADVKPEDTVIVMPIDTYAGQEYYSKILDLDIAVQTNKADIVLLGVKPIFPSEKYGYIVPEEVDEKEDVCEVLSVKCFVEKPNPALAKELIDQGALWNCGVFAFKLSYLTRLIDRYIPNADFDEARQRYSELPKNSFDYEVVENAQSVAVVPYGGEWKDLGTWNTLTEEMADVASGAVTGVETCSNVHVINELGIPVVTLGIEDAVVVATHDGILVSDKEASSQMKPYVEKAAASRPMYERRRWGEYRVLDSGVYPDGKKALVKELVVDPGCQLSYQLHNHRSEVWTIVSGTGEVVIDGVVNPVMPGMTLSLPQGRKHAVRAFTEIHAIEVQFGDLLSEGDIERFGDFWNV